MSGDFVELWYRKASRDYRLRDLTGIWIHCIFIAVLYAAVGSSFNISNTNLIARILGYQSTRNSP